MVTAMGKPQIAVRVPPALLAELDCHVERTGISKTDVVVTAIAQYLGCADEVPLNQRVAALELQVKELTALIQSGATPKKSASKSRL